MDFVTTKLYKIMNLYLQLTTKSKVPYYEYKRSVFCGETHKNNWCTFGTPPLAHIFSRLVQQCKHGKWKVDHLHDLTDRYHVVVSHCCS